MPQPTTSDENVLAALRDAEGQLAEYLRLNDDASALRHLATATSDVAEDTRDVPLSLEVRR